MFDLLEYAPFALGGVMGGVLFYWSRRVHDLKYKVKDYHTRWHVASEQLDRVENEKDLRILELEMEVLAFSGALDREESERRRLQAQRAFDERVRLRKIDLSQEAVVKRMREREENEAWRKSLGRGMCYDYQD